MTVAITMPAQWMYLRRSLSNACTAGFSPSTEVQCRKIIALSAAGTMLIAATDLLGFRTEVVLVQPRGFEIAKKLH